MISIVLAIVLGIGFTVIALQNPTSVPVNFFGFFFTLPLYILSAIIFLAGTFVALFFSLFDKTSSVLDLRERDTKIREVERANHTMQNQVRELLAENENLKAELANTRANLRGERVSSTKENVRNFFGRIKDNLSPRKHSRSFT